MLYKVVSEDDSVTKIHLRSHNINDCWSYVRERLAKPTEIKYLVVDRLDRPVKQSREGNAINV